MYDKMNPPIGTVGYANSHGIFAFLQHIFSGPGASHAFLITYPIGLYNSVPMVFEADMTVTHTPYEKYITNGTQWDYFLYTMPEFNLSEIQHALDRCTKEFSGVAYGFTQLLWFPYRKVMSWFGKDVRKAKNWFTAGVICTELWWWFLWYATELFPEKHTKLRAILEQWEPDTIQAYDVKLIIQKNVDMFVPWGQYINGVYIQITI